MSINPLRRKLSLDSHSLLILALILVWMPIGRVHAQSNGKQAVCPVITLEQVKVLLGAERLPEEDTTCKFLLSNFDLPSPPDPYKVGFLMVARHAMFENKLEEDKTFTSQSISYLEQTYKQKCEAPFTVEHKPALWCTRDAARFSYGFATYNLLIHDDEDMRGVSILQWKMPADAAKAAAINVAEVAFFHKPVPAEVLRTAAAGNHPGHGLKKGVWGLVETSKGSGYLNQPLLAPSAYAACVDDGGASLQKLVPLSIESCSRKVEQVSPSRESLSVECQSESPNHQFIGYLDSYRMQIDYVDAEHYTVDGTHIKYGRTAINAWEPASAGRQEIGSSSFQVVATWKNAVCTVNTAEPVPLTGTSLINR